MLKQKSRRGKIEFTELAGSQDVHTYLSEPRLWMSMIVDDVVQWVLGNCRYHLVKVVGVVGVVCVVGVVGVVAEHATLEGF